MTGDLPDYEKKIVIVTVPGEYPAEMQVDLTKILGVTLQDPTIPACIPVSVEHIIQTDARQILGVALMSPTIAQCMPTSIENPAIAYDETNDRFKVDIEAMTVGTITTDISDKWARQLGLIDLSRVLGAALSHSNPVIARLTNGSAFIDPTDVKDRAARLVGIVYGDKGQLAQRTTSLDLFAALRYSGAEIDPRSIRALTNSDVVTVEQATAASLKATVTQASSDRTISSIDATATKLQVSISGLNGNSSALVTPASGKAIRIKFISLEHSADVDLGFRFAAAGTIYYLRITKGLYVSNLIGANAQGAADEALYLNSSAATNVKGYILYSEV